ncbi:hypothetical protein PF011_g5113 [Phytophthora fragariae]|uniref:Integrase catalytic domain-containing protein n=1 Tax=Phytophthora fragariae TaxID=53985 RepID=A0A6A3LNX1_9STRA|nr:hypothetical protein PF011_g5113 [Phytophthora fragariae]
MDYLFIGTYNGESNYLLVMKDDVSHYCELIECSSANAATSAMVILDWNSRYGMPQLLISDAATHFKNQLLEELCHKTQMTQSFTLAYCPWINGSVERLNRDILQVLRVMLLEYKVEQDNWTALLPLIQANLNHSPVASLANHAPAEVFLGVKANTPLQKILIGSDAIAANVVTTGDFSPGVREAVGNLRASLDGMHREVATAKEKQTKRNQSNQRGARSVNFHVGDYVLWSRVDAKKQGNKLSVTWVGPYRVIGAKANSFEIEHLITATTKLAHASRLKMYADQSLDVNEEMLAHIANQDIYLTVEAFTQHRKHATNTYEILVRWEGLEAITDSWEPVMTMYEDVPIKLQVYVDSAADDKLRQFVIQLRSHSQGRKRKESTVQPTPSHRRGKRGGDVAAQPKPPKLNRRQHRAKGNTKK